MHYAINYHYAVVCSFSAASDTNLITLHYYNLYDWNEVYIYCYGGSTKVSTWPGALMDNDGDGWYTYSIEAAESATVIFTNGNGHQIPGRFKSGFSVNSESWIVNDSIYQSLPGDEIIKQEKDLPDITVHFFNSGNWDDVYIYQYSGSVVGKIFPGTKMKPEGNGWYRYDIYGYEKMNVIINNGITGEGRAQYPYINQNGFLVEGEKWITKLELHNEKPEGMKIHFFNAFHWEAPHLYYYNSTGNKDSDFPGVEMFDDGNGWYSYPVYGYDKVYAIFGDGNQQQIPGTSYSGFEITDETWFANDTLYTQQPDEIEELEPIKIYFYNNDNWKDVYIHYYDNSNTNVIYRKRGDAWPGNKMTLLNDNLYSYTIYGYEQAQVIFNNNSGKQYPPRDPNNPTIGPEGYYVSGTMYYIDGVWYNENTDTDNDGLPDIAEIFIGTDSKNPDTDKDGLPDGYEFETLKSNPLAADSDSNGISDADEDNDDDGLTNIKEYLYGTDPSYEDTDADRLSDYDEVHLYFTNPLIYDSDNDGLGDGVEIDVQLDPLRPDSLNDGILDGERIVTQNYLLREHENFDINDTQVTPEIEITGAGDFIKKIYVNDVSSEHDIADHDYIVGHPFDFVHEEELDFNSAAVSFNIGQDILEKYDGKDLMIARYNEESKMYEPIETSFNKESNKLTAQVDDLCIFTVIVDYLFYSYLNPHNPNSIQPPQDYFVKYGSASWGINLQAPTKNYHVVIYEYDILANATYYYEVMADDASIPGAITAPQQIRFTDCIVYKHMQNGTVTKEMYESYMIPYSYSGQLQFVYTNRDILGPFGRVAYYERPFQNTPVKVRLSNGTWVQLDKDPRLGDITLDSDGDGIPDLDELGKQKRFTRYNWLRDEMETFDVWEFKSDPSYFTVDYGAVLKRAFGFNQDQSDLIIKTYKMTENIRRSHGTNRSTDGGRAYINSFYGMLAGLCFQYDGIRWRMTANINSRNKVEEQLKNSGLTQQEILDIVVTLNFQHGSEVEDFEKENVDYTQSKFKDRSQEDYIRSTMLYPKDFLHEMYVLAAFSNENNNGLARLSVDIFNSDFKTGRVCTNYEASFKGDIDSTRHGDGDFASDIDAINCYYLMLDSDKDILDIFLKYNYDIQNGNKNMAKEFFLNLGDGSVSVGINEMMEILAAETPGSTYIQGENKGAPITKGIDYFVNLVFNEYNKVR